MNFIACIVKSAGSKVSANDLMYCLIILDKSHSKNYKAILSPPLTAAWFEHFQWEQNVILILLPGEILPAWKRSHSQTAALSIRRRWYCIAQNSSECELRASPVPGILSTLELRYCATVGTSAWPPFYRNKTKTHSDQEIQRGSLSQQSQDPNSGTSDPKVLLHSLMP